MIAFVASLGDYQVCVYAIGRHLEIDKFLRLTNYEPVCVRPWWAPVIY